MVGPGRHLASLRHCSWQMVWFCVCFSRAAEVRGQRDL